MKMFSIITLFALLFSMIAVPALAATYSLTVKVYEGTAPIVGNITIYDNAGNLVQGPVYAQSKIFYNMPAANYRLQVQNRSYNMYQEQINLTANTITYARLTRDSTGPTITSLTSSTHPDESVWYDFDNPSFEWIASDGSGSGIDGFSFSIDATSGTVPDTTKDAEEAIASRSYSLVGSGTWYFHIRAVDNAGNWGPAVQKKIQIDFAPPVCMNENVLPIAPTYTPGQTYTFSITCNDNSPLTAVLKLNDSLGNSNNYVGTGTNDFTTTITDLAAGDYLYRWLVTDSNGNTMMTNLQSYSISRAQIGNFMQLSMTSSPTDYLTPSFVTGSATLPGGADDVVFNLYRNGALVTTGNPASETATLNAGTYVYVFNTTGGQNWTAGSVSSTLVVNQISNPVSLFLNDMLDQDVTITYGTQSNATGVATGGAANVWRNGTFVGPEEVGVLPAGVWEYKVNSTGDINYLPNATGVTQYLIIEKAASDVSFTLPMAPLTYGDATEVTCTGTTGDNGATLNLYRNGVLVNTSTSNDVSDNSILGVGTYGWACDYLESQNYTATSESSMSVTVNKATPTLTLLLNDSDSNMTAEIGSVVNATAVMPTVGNIVFDYEAFVDGVSVGTANSLTATLIDTGTLSLGDHTIAIVFSGNENYTSANDEHRLTLTDTAAPIVTILSPTNTTYNSDTIDINWTSNEPVSWAAYSIDGGANVTITGNTTLTSLPGDHTLVVYINDGSGNQGTATVTFTLNPTDTIPPIIKRIWNTTPVWAGLPAGFRINATDNYIVTEITVDGTPATWVSGDIWQSTIDVPSVDGLYRFLVVARDYAGNTAERNISIKVNISADPNATFDVGPPTISTVWPTNVMINTETNLSANVSDDNSIINCTLFIDGVAVTNITNGLPSSQATLSAPWTFTSPGNHSAFMACYDSWDNLANGTETIINVYQPVIPGGGNVGGTGFSMVRPQAVDIVVQGPVIVDTGTTSVFTAEVTLTGRAADVSVSISGVPYTVTVTPKSAEMNADGTQTFVINVAVPADAAVGVYPITVTATSASGQTDSAQVNMIVKKPGQSAEEVVSNATTTNQTPPSGLAGALLAATSNPLTALAVLLIIAGIVGWLWYKKPELFDAFRRKQKVTDGGAAGNQPSNQPAPTMPQ